MKNSFIHIVETDSIELLKNKIESMYPDVKQILEYDITKTGIKSLLFAISSNPLIRIKRAFIIENLFAEDKERVSKGINMDKNPAGALKFIEKLTADSDLDDFIDNAVNRMDKNTYKQLGLDGIAVFSKREKLLNLLDLDMSDVSVDIEKFLHEHSSDHNLLFILISGKDNKAKMRDMSACCTCINLIRGKKAYGYQTVSPSVKSFIIEYADKENIRITDEAVSLLCEFTSNKIDAIKNELVKLRSLLKDRLINEQAVAEIVKKESTVDIFYVINEIFDSDLNTAYGIVTDIMQGNVLIDGIDIDSFIFILLPQMVSHLHHAIFAKELINRYNLKDIEKKGYNVFKSKTYEYLVEQLKKEDSWVQNRSLNILASHPYRAYQVFIWAARHKSSKLKNIILSIGELDRLMKSSKISIKNKLFEIISMIYF